MRLAPRLQRRGQPSSTVDEVVDELVGLAVDRRVDELLELPVHPGELVRDFPA
jgi:hypothetical protein